MRAYLSELAAKSAKTGYLGLPESQFLFGQIAGLYGIALAAVAVALGARLALGGILGDESPYLFFVPAVLVAGGVAGLGPGLLATVLSTVLATFVVRRSHDISAAELVNAAAFALLGLAISW